jgi:SAM-dependent methyltransferase
VTFSSRQYWEERYAAGGTSGEGSVGENARFKADFLNQFAKDHQVRDVLDLGCGDGSQLLLADYPFYIGMDVSASAVAKCRILFAEDPCKKFYGLPGPKLVADLVLSLDVIYHLVEDDVYEQHLHDVFEAGLKWVVLYTTDSDFVDNTLTADHVRHRPFFQDVQRLCGEWTFVDFVENPLDLGGADFYVYER